MNRSCLTITASCLAALVAAGTVQAAEDSRWIDHGNGTVTDRNAQRIITKNADCFGPLTWEQAQAAVAKLAHGTCGLKDGSKPGDWRLPVKDELLLLMDWNQSGRFTLAPPKNYWSGTPLTNNPENAWVVLLSNGYVSYNPKNLAAHTWPVRSVEGR